jgi:mRNA interferase MazF
MKQKELHLVAFPFSDLSGTKVRPVLVVSNDKFNAQSKDVIVCAITTRKQHSSQVLSSDDLDTGKLHTNCYIKAEIIFKCSKNVLLKKTGSVSDNILQITRKNIVNLL